MHNSATRNINKKPTFSFIVICFFISVNMNFEKNDNKIYNNTSVTKSFNKQKSDFSLDSDESSFNTITNPSLVNNNIIFSNNFIVHINELLQELYTYLLNLEFQHEFDYLCSKFIYTFLFEYDLDPNNVFKILTSNSQNIICYSSLIGFFYQYGIGCEVDKIKAFEIYSNTIKNDHKLILNQFSFDHKNEIIIFYNDDIIKLNEKVTQFFYSLLFYKDIISHKIINYKLNIKNVEKGDNVSQYNIGNCYRYGINMKKDYNKAIEWYLKSSEGGNIKAMYELGIFYQYGNEYGYGVIKNEKKAFELYLKSAEGGYKRALFKVGNCYQYGNCTFEDKNKAFEFYLKAAEKGYPYSQYNVANYYNYSYDEEKGFYWIRKAAIKGNKDAQYKLAEYYLKNSINKNERKAFKWYLKLANEYEHRGMHSVVKCYIHGIGTDINLKEVKKWVKKHEDIYKQKFNECKLL
jgi:TPR repeat protein